MIIMSSNAFTDDQARFKECLEKFFLKSGMRVVIKKMETSPGCAVGENFVAEITRIAVSGYVYLTDGKTEDIRESFIVKRIPGPESVNHKFFNCRNMFANEIIGYEVVIQSFEDFVTGKNCKKNFRSCFAKYLGSAYDFIALEDLKTKGYRMGNRLQGFHVQECLLVLEKLAFFHSISFAMKATEKEKFEEIAGRLTETVFSKEMAEGVVRVYWENAVKFAVTSLVGRGDEKLKGAIATLLSYKDSAFLSLMDVIKPEEPFDVICHGDLWTNNILLRYAEGEAIDVKMIDLQSMRHGSCVLDVMHLLFTSLETGCLKMCFNEIITIYYNYLVLYMKGFGVEPEFSLQQLRDEFRRRVQFGVCVACLGFTFVTKTTPGDSADTVPSKEELSREDEIVRTYLSLNELYHERLYNLITALTALGMI